MKLAMQIKNKMGFLDGSCVKTDYAASPFVRGSMG